MAYTVLRDLQSLLLALAVFPRLNDHCDEGIHPDLYAYEALTVHWGSHTHDGSRLLPWDRRTPHRPHFPKAWLAPRYQAARVTVSKAFRRLEQRGLVTRSYGVDGSLALHLTATGIPVANQAWRRFAPQ